MGGRCCGFRKPYNKRIRQRLINKYYYDFAHSRDGPERLQVLKNMYDELYQEYRELGIPTEPYPNELGPKVSKSIHTDSSSSKSIKSKNSEISSTSMKKDKKGKVNEKKEKLQKKGPKSALASQSKKSKKK